MESIRPLIGFVGQGYVGKNSADDFESRGYAVVRYSLEEPHVHNKNKLQDCDIVFIAVPTPTSPAAGFDDSIVREALALVGSGKIAVIKSTVLPGTTKLLQTQYPNLIIFYSPEFLSEVSAAHDAANPFANILGAGGDSPAHKEAASIVRSVCPEAPFALDCSSTEAELIKYSHNGSGFVEIVFFNLMYDLAEKLGADWSKIEKAMQADPYIAHRYAKPVHKSGRGAGGHCFIKDFSALSRLYSKLTDDATGTDVFNALERKNITLLKKSGKDLDLLRGVYGDGV